MCGDSALWMRINYVVATMLHQQNPWSSFIVLPRLRAKLATYEVKRVGSKQHVANGNCSVNVSPGQPRTQLKKVSTDVRI